MQNPSKVAGAHIILETPGLAGAIILNGHRWVQTCAGLFVGRSVQGRPKASA